MCQASWIVATIAAIIVVALIVVAVLCALGFIPVRYQRMAKLARMQALPQNLQPGALSGIPLVIFINMDKSVERRRVMEDQLRITSGDAAVRRSPGVLYDPLKRPLGYSDHLRNAERGCTQAHFDAISMALAEGVSHALILEDDASLHLSTAWPETLASLVARAPRGWDFIRLFGFQTKLFSDTGPAVLFQEPRADVYSAAAYLISRAGMLKTRAATNNFTTTFGQDSLAVDITMVNSTGAGMKNYILSKAYVLPFVNGVASTIQPPTGAWWQNMQIEETIKLLEKDKAFDINWTVYDR